MIKIKPEIEHNSNCPYCQSNLQPVQVNWHGMYTYIESQCPRCNSQLLESLEISHVIDHPYQIDVSKGQILGDKTAQDHAQHLLKALENPIPEQLNIEKEIFKSNKQVILLNCLDFWYGHCLLKLLNAQRHLDSHPSYGLVVIIPSFLRWMVPDGVAEIWTVPIPLKQGLGYYPSFSEFVSAELKRFDEVYVSKAHSHPSQFDVTRFTQVPKHRFDQDKEIQITYIWREDRLWFDNESGWTSFIFRVLKKLKIHKPIVILQNWRVRQLLSQLRMSIPFSKFAVAGLGKQTKFPSWIEDFRVDKFDEKSERGLCKIYSESRLVIGRHGSNMLLPSGHAGMTLDLMPDGRWNNLAQDILYQETDPRIASLRYRYIPLHTNLNRIASIASKMVLRYSHLHAQMIADQQRKNNFK